MANTYEPDRWVIIGDGKNFKIFGSWVGGYLGSDNWRLSSGLLKVERKDDGEILGHNYSGSIYKLREVSQGIAGSYNSSVLHNVLEQLNSYNEKSEVRVYSLEEYEKIQKSKED